jgi:hypothetical protein
VRRVAADAPLLGAGREQVEPDLSPREEGNVRVEREAGAAQEAERRRVRLPGAATFVRPVTTTLPTQREPNRNVAFLCAVPLPCFHACGCAFVSPSPMGGRRPTPSLWRRHTVATSGRRAGCPCERVLVLRPVHVEPRFIPRRAAVPSAVRMLCLVFLWPAFVPWCSGAEDGGEWAVIMHTRRTD